MAEQIAHAAELLDYVRKNSLRDDPLLRELRERTAELPAGKAMQVSPEEAQFLSLLVRLTDAANVVEVGTYTGYSTLCMARALPPHGRLVTCEVNRKWTDIAAGFWRRAGVAERIDVRIGDAAEALAALCRECPGSFDMAFIDADKASYRSYYESCLELVRPGGLLVLDNTLFFGRVVDPSARDRDTLGIREINAALAADDRVEISMLMVADGMTLARKNSR
ncbi:class I SAM-dependent methyltransferase [Amycolatopsis sp. CA-230715]|uniref:class I SAM-dependent methyltransferase n=1 Tax=Amycolatopsis sp. CA-230715 TaxID=2745196 RepID=UPI001C027C8D|nr:class I SAM-dependent methyltransferase [Amycolatopsis sp. CA-230715]QWF84525.1 Putative O-methyltransferase/MSMEI_4947 [Amycolatopsis sp. CA-230715]